MYLRWIVDPSPRSVAMQRASEIVEKNKKAKFEVLRLRKKLQILMKEADKLGLVVEGKLEDIIIENEEAANEMGEDEDDLSITEAMEMNHKQTED